MRLILILVCPIFALSIGDIGPVRGALNRAFLHSSFNQKLRIMKVSKEFDDYAEAAQYEIDALNAQHLSDTLYSASVKKLAAKRISRDTNKITLRFPDSTAMSGMMLEDFQALNAARIFKVIVPEPKDAP